MEMICYRKERLPGNREHVIWAHLVRAASSGLSLTCFKSNTPPPASLIRNTL